MTKNTIPFSKIDSEFCEYTSSCMEDMQLTTSKKIINTRINELKSRTEKYRSYKHQAISSDSPELNMAACCLLYFQCLSQCLLSIFKCFESIKSESNYSAWCSLIDATEYLGISKLALIKVSERKETLETLEEISTKIKHIELGVFPTHKVFTSPGFIEEIGSCSICGESFIECNHVEGEIYGGLYCMRTQRRPIELNHTAMVKNPRDRRCIFTTRFNAEDEQVDVFSREKTQSPSEKNTYSAIIFQVRDLEIN